MRHTLIGAAVLFSISLVFAQTGDGKIVQPKEGIAGVYANQIRQLYEEALFRVTAADRLLVLEEKGDFYKVQSTEGEMGWIEKRLCINLGRSAKFTFKSIGIEGYPDNPTLINIGLPDDPGFEPISLDRSFRDAIRDNVDEECVRRQAR